MSVQDALKPINYKSQIVSLWKLNLTFATMVVRKVTTHFKDSPPLFLFLLQAMCLYCGISHKQQGPLSMPGATRCHVNMAGYSSSSCILGCFNERGEFCEANTASGRYCTCVPCFFMYCTHVGPRNPIHRVFLSFKRAPLLAGLDWTWYKTSCQRKHQGMGKGTWEPVHATWGSSCQSYQFLDY